MVNKQERKWKRAERGKKAEKIVQCAQQESE